MGALASELFREVRPGMFRVLAGKNAATYVDVLDSLEAEASQRQEGMSREEALGIVGEVLAKHPDFVPDDGEMQPGVSEEFASLPLRERARRVVDHLARKDVGWLEDVQLPDWQRRIRFDAHGATLLDALHPDVPDRWRKSWQKCCAEFQQAAIQGAAIAPFSRDDLAANSELLALVPKLLAWHAKGEESLLRFASCVLTSNSKRLGELAAEDDGGSRRGKLGAILERVTGGRLRSLEDVGIPQAPRFALVHGPIRLLLDGEWLNLGSLQGPCRLSETDITRAERVETPARRCLTVENETSFHELAKLRSGELLICTSYPGSATLALLSKLPDALEFWHFGDSDPEGFDILRDLRERTRRPFRSLHMNWRPAANSPTLDAAEERLVNKLLKSAAMQSEREVLKTMLNARKLGSFEQESLGRPTQREWPFYS